MERPTFTPETESLLDRAAALCAGRQQKLTDQRRQILGLILESPRPSGAYDLLDRLRLAGKPAAPPTVYRALDFLTAQGLVHRIERLSAFVGCAHMLQSNGHEGCDRAHVHHGIEAIQFLICTECRRAFEITDPRIRGAIQQATGAAGFRMTGMTVEIEGLCADCLSGNGQGQIPPALS